MYGQLHPIIDCLTSLCALTLIFCPVQTLDTVEAAEMFYEKGRSFGVFSAGTGKPLHI